MLLQVHVQRVNDRRHTCMCLTNLSASSMEWVEMSPPPNTSETNQNLLGGEPQVSHVTTLERRPLLA